MHWRRCTRFTGRVVMGYECSCPCSVHTAVSAVVASGGGVSLFGRRRRCRNVYTGCHSRCAVVDDPGIRSNHFCYTVPLRTIVRAYVWCMCAPPAGNRKKRIKNRPTIRVDRARRVCVIFLSTILFCAFTFVFRSPFPTLLSLFLHFSGLLFLRYCVKTEDDRPVAFFFVFTPSAVSQPHRPEALYARRHDDRVIDRWITGHCVHDIVTAYDDNIDNTAARARLQQRRKNINHCFSFEQRSVFHYSKSGYEKGELFIC